MCFNLKKKKKKKKWGVELHLTPLNFHRFCNHPLKVKKNSQFSVSIFKKFEMSPFPLKFGVKSDDKWVKFLRCAL
jgi:hypothetical protein